MKMRLPSIQKCFVLLLSLTILSAQADDLNNKKKSDAGARMHWVHLSGHFGNNAVDRAAMVKVINYCAAITHPNHAPEGNQIPELVHAVDTDLYIAPNRVMKINHQTLVSYNPVDCSLKISHHDIATLASMKGTCNIDLTEKIATGVCDVAEHENAPPLTELMALQDTSSAANKARRPQKTGGTKVIAGLKCDVYQETSPVKRSFCISNAGSFIASPIQSFTGIIPGLHLEEISENMNNQVATEVHLDASLNPEIFAIPKDVTVKSSYRIDWMPRMNGMPGTAR